MKTIVVLGSGGFIGNNLSHKLKSDPNNFIIGADLKEMNLENKLKINLFLLT